MYQQEEGQMESHEVDVLKRGHELIVEGFTTGAFARNDAGESVKPSDPTATSFCSLGACSRAAHEFASGDEHLASVLYLDAATTLNHQVGSIGFGFYGSYLDIADWNDHAPWPQIERGWLDAISTAEEHVLSVP